MVPMRLQQGSPVVPATAVLPRSVPAVSQCTSPSHMHSHAAPQVRWYPRRQHCILLIATSAVLRPICSYIILANCTYADKLSLQPEALFSCATSAAPVLRTLPRLSAGMKLAVCIQTRKRYEQEMLDVTTANSSVAAAAVDSGKHSILVSEKLGSAGTALLTCQMLSKPALSVL